jgi:hypothetical protein
MYCFIYVLWFVFLVVVNQTLVVVGQSPRPSRARL